MDYNHNNITGAPTIYLSIIYYSSHNLYSFYVIKSHIKMSLLKINWEKRCILDVDHLLWTKIDIRVFFSWSRGKIYWMLNMIRDNIHIFVYFINTACMKDSVAFQNKNNYWCMHAMNNEHIQAWDILQHFQMKITVLF